MRGGREGGNGGHCGGDDALVVTSLLAAMCLEICFFIYTSFQFVLLSFVRGPECLIPGCSSFLLLWREIEKVREVAEGGG